jgi:hypothetical protein
MSQPVWITPAGSLGVIPEGVFYQQTLLATAPAIGTPTIVSATTGTTNIITCGNTSGVVPGMVVIFTGTNFGNLQENTVYYVLTVLSATTFTVTATAESTTPVTLTTATGYLIATFYQRVYYRLIAGTLPGGVQITSNGQVTGVPQAFTNVQGVPSQVSEDVTSKFVVRAYTFTPVANSTTIDRIQDRTFTLTITGNNVPEFVTPAGSIGTYYDGDYVDIQLLYTGLDPNESNLIRLVAGQLPLGTRITTSGLISGYIQPFPNQNELVGYDLTPSGVPPYDFVVSAISKNYQFTLEITDGKTSSLRTFTIYVYNRDDLTGDNTTITGDNTFVTADETTERAPFLLNFEPSSLGSVRSDNYYAYRFVGQDYDTNDVEYVITVNEGTGLPPGLILDRYTGWYYGYIPDQGTTEIDYSFNIQVRARTLVCTATTAGTNEITCDTAVRADVYVGTRIVFEGTTFGGIVEGQFYYVASIPSATTITVSTVLGGSVLALSTASGEMLGIPRDLPSSQLYPFVLTVVGAVDQEVTWLTDSDLGILENGAISLFKISATNRGGRKLFYRLASGEFNQLPQGLTLLESGEIAGRASFNTFSIDLGATTFDASQSTVSGIEETTFDLTFVFTVNAYATDPTQLIYEVAGITVVSGGLGYGTGATSPVIAISSPAGALSFAAEAGAATVVGSSITAVAIADPGAGYIAPALVSVVQGYGGSGANLEAVMRLTGTKEIVSVFKTFTIKLVREYNKPYQNLFVLAMPPQNDRIALRELLSNTNIFPPEYIYRSDDANFGLSTRVKYQHAFGLDPDTFETYVSSLYENHYWKNLILGAVETAQAIDPVTGEVVYEVVYSKIIDNLVNAADQSVAKIVTLPYPVLLDDSTEVFSVYPNSLINMRDQVIDVVGQISTKLPLWMTSKQSNGRVLGFTPAWVICYTNPGRSSQIAYYLGEYSTLPLNNVDFKVDRYELDATLSKNWDPNIQNWTPDPSLTTFDRVNATGYADLGLVQACTTLAFTDVNNRTVDYINALGGLDGFTWLQTPGQTPPSNTQVIVRNGSRIVFVRQENYDAPYTDIAEAWSNYLQPFDEVPFDTATALTSPGTFDYGLQVLGGFVAACDATNAATDIISCDTTANMIVGDKVWFTGSVFGGISTETDLGLTQVYYVTDISNIRCTATVSSTDRISCTSTAALSVGDEVYFKADTIESTATQTEALGDFIQLLTVTNIVVGMPIVFPNTVFGGIVSGTTYYVSSISATSKKITISATYLGPIFALSDATGSMSFIAGGTFGNLVDRLATGLTRVYYVVEISSGTQFQVSDTAGGSPVQLGNSNGVMYVYYGAFQVSETLGGTPVALTTDTGTMSVNYANNRMAIYVVTVDTSGVLQLTLETQTVTDDYITSTQGARFAAGTALYRPAAAAENLTRVNWQPLISNATVVTSETIFDMGSLQFIEPVDMYDTSDQYDKYLVFPKPNILV